MGKCVRLLTLVAWFTLGALGVAAADTNSGVQWLSSTAQSGGDYTGPNDISTPFQSTAEALRTLGALGSLPNTAASAALQFLAAEPYQNTENLSRLITSVVAAGQNPSTAVSQLLTYQDSSTGGFSELPGYQPTVLDTSFALEALSLGGAGSTQAAGKAVSFLLQQQASDGSWTETDGDNAPSVYLTALAMRSVWFYRQIYNVSQNLTNATSWLLAQTDANGNWAAPFLSAEALIAIAPTLENRSSIQASLQALQSQQLSDGSFDDDAYTTALALRALLYASQPDPDQTSLQGKVIDGQTGNALSGVTVTLTQSSQTYTATTASDGTFDFTNIAPGSYSIQIADSGFGTIISTTQAGTGQDVNLGSVSLTPGTSSGGSTSATVYGTVTDASSGNPIAGATIAIGSLSTTTAANGAYEIANIPTGTVSFSANATGYLTAAGSASLSAGSTTIFSPRLETTNGGGSSNGTGTGTVQGVVTDASTGNGIAGATVGVGALNTTTAATGSYVLSGVPAGSVSVTVSAAGYQAASGSGTLNANGVMLFSPQLTTEGLSTVDPSTVTGVVTDANSGNPIAGATVSLSGSTTESVQTDATGSYSIGGIFTGTIHIVASAAGHDSASATTQAFGNTVITFSPKLYPTGTSPAGANTATLSGTVVDASTGQPLAGVSVSATGGATVQTASDGTFQIRGLTSSPATLSFQIANYLSASFSVNFPPAVATSLGTIRLRPKLTTALLPDLTVTLVDSKSTASTDPQKLAISGTVQATVSNIGEAYANGGFSVLAFYDVNQNGAYDSGVDIALGQMQVSQPIEAGQSTQVQIPVSGTLPFRDALVSVLADSTNQVLESNKTNNIGVSNSACLPPDGETVTYYGMNPYPNNTYPGENVNPATTRRILILGDQDGTTFKIRPLSGSVAPITGTVNRLQAQSISLNGVSQFALDASNRLTAVLETDFAGVESGNMFYPSQDGASFYGTDFVAFSPSYLGTQDQMVVFALDDAVVSVYDTSGNLLQTTPDLAAGSYQVLTGLPATVVHLVSTGRIAVENNTGNGMTVVPPVPTDSLYSNRYSDVGTTYFFGTYKWDPQKGSGVASVANLGATPASFNLTNLATGAVVLSNQTVAPGQIFVQIGLGTNYYRLDVLDGQVMVQGGDCESNGSHACGINDFGDDVVFARGLNGLKEIVNVFPSPYGGNPVESAYVFAPNDNTHVVVNGGAPQTLNLGQYTQLPNGAIATVTSDKPIITQITGGGDDYYTNDWAKVLLPPQRVGLPDLTTGDLRIIDNGTGNPFTLEVRIGDGSPYAAPATTVSFYSGDPSNGGTRIGSVAVNALAASAYQDVQLTGVTGLSAGQSIYAVVDPQNLIEECDKTNNIDSTSLSTAVPAGDITVSTDASTYGPNATANFTGVGANLGNVPDDFKVDLRVEDSSGNVVVDLGTTDFGVLAGGATANDAVAWNTGTTVAGSYVLHGLLLYASGSLAAQAYTPFSVGTGTGSGGTGTGPNTEITLRVTTDKQNYSTTDQVNIGDLVQDVSVNGIVGSASLQLTLLNPSGATAYNVTMPLGQLSPGYLKLLSNLYPLQGAEQGTYTVNGTIVDGSGDVLATGSASFTVAENQSLTIIGSEAVSVTPVYQDQPETCTDTVTDRGTQGVTNLPLQQLVIDLDTGTLDQQSSATVTLAAGASQTLPPRTFSTHPLAYGNHACVIQAQINGSYQTLASAAFLVQQPPIRVSGTEAVQVNPVYQDATETCIDTINNTGSQNLTSLPLEQVVMNTDTGIIDQQINLTVSLASGATQTLTRSFSTHTLAYGHHACVLLAEPQGTTYQQLASAAFVVQQPPIRISGTEAVQTNPIVQGATQTCTDTISNTGSQNLTSLPVEQVVMNTDTGTVDQQTNLTVSLASGATQTLTRSFSTSALAYGNHACVLLAEPQGTTYQQLASAAFVVQQPPVRIVGTESVQSASLNQGDAQTCTDTVSNTGTQSFSALPVEQLVLNTDTGTVDQQTNLTANLPSGGSQQYVRNFSTSGLAIGNHACVIEAQVNGSYQQLASAPFVVKQPPVSVTGSLGLGAKGRLLVLMDAPTDHGPPLCNNGLLSVTLEAGFQQNLSPDAVVQVKVLDALGLLVDTETTSLRSFSGEVQGNAGSHGIDLVIPSFTADSLVVQLVGAGGLLSGTYRVVAIVSDSANLQYFTLDSGLVSLTCNSLGILGDLLGGAFRVIGINDPNSGDIGPGDGADSVGAAQQETYLQSLLSQDGWSFDVSTSSGDFAAKFRDGGYQNYALLSEYEVLDPQVQEELREHVNSGEGLLVAGRHDVRNRILDPVLGILYSATQPQPVGLQTLTGNVYGLSGSESFSQNNQVQRLLPEGANADANVISGVPTAQLTAVTNYGYGNGQSALGAYDMLAEASAEPTPGLFSSLIRQPLIDVNPSQAAPVSGRVWPIHLTVTNTGVANTTKVTVATSLGSYVVSANAGTVANGQLSWTTSLAVGQSTGIDFWIQLPVGGIPVTVTATLVASAGNYTALPVTVTETLNPVARPSLAKAISDLTTYVANQPPPGLLGQLLDPILGIKTPAAAALDELNEANQDLSSGNVQRALIELVQATGLLINDGSTGIVPIRLEVDEAIEETEKLQ